MDAFSQKSDRKRKKIQSESMLIDRFPLILGKKSKSRSIEEIANDLYIFAKDDPIDFRDARDDQRF